jgi:uncharacterized lipoprotein YmbA
MKNRFHLPRLFSLAALTLLLASCASSPSVRYYTLTPVGALVGKTSSQEAANHLSVSIAPVEIPDYLDRPQIATREGQHELKLAEYDRWAGSLSGNISAVLAENISAFLGSDRVSVYPRIRGDKPDFAVAMRILWLDCVPGKRVLLKAQWTIFAGQDRKDIATRTMNFTEILGDKRYETMVAGFSRTIEQASREIARDIASRK